MLDRAVGRGDRPAGHGTASDRMLVAPVCNSPMQVACERLHAAIRQTYNTQADGQVTASLTGSVSTVRSPNHNAALNVSVDKQRVNTDINGSRHDCDMSLDWLQAELVTVG